MLLAHSELLCFSDVELLNSQHECFGCRKFGRDNVDVFKCSKSYCGRFYHVACRVRCAFLLPSTDYLCVRSLRSRLRRSRYPRMRSPALATCAPLAAPSTATMSWHARSVTRLFVRPYLACIAVGVPPLQRVVSRRLPAQERLPQAELQDDPVRQAPAAGVDVRLADHRAQRVPAERESRGCQRVSFSEQRQQ